MAAALVTERTKFCMFETFSAKECGPITKAEAGRTVNLLSLKNCDRDVITNMGRLGIQKESQLLLARHGDFHLGLVDYNEESLQLDDFNVCQFHRNCYGTSWSTAATACSVPSNISRHNQDPRRRPRGDKRCTLIQSEIVFLATKVLLPVGSRKHFRFRVI